MFSILSIQRTVAAFLAIVLGPGTTLCLEEILHADDDRDLVVHMRQLSEELLMQNVFGNRETIDMAWVSADRALNGQIEILELHVKLTEAQRAKLDLAGQGDIERFLIDVESFLRAAPIGPVSARDWERVWRDLRPLEMRYRAGLHGADSLFRKTFRSTLDVEQLRAIHDVERAHYRDLVKSTASRVEAELHLSLSPEQRERFVEVVVEKTEPLPYSETVVCRNGQTGITYRPVVEQMSMIESDLKPLFDEQQWELLERAFESVRSHQIPMQ